MTAKAKLQIVKPEPEAIKPTGDAPDNLPLEDVHKYTMQQLVGSGRHIEERAKRIIFDFPDAKVEFKQPRSVFNRMMELAKNKL